MRVLTASGRAAAATAVASAIAAVLLHEPALAALAVATGGAVALAVLSNLRRLDLVVDRDLSRPRVAVGAPVELLVTVTAGRRRAPTLRGHDHVGPIGGPGLPFPVEVPSVEAGRSVVVRIPVPVPRRGVFEVGPLTLERGDPLGLTRNRVARAGVTTLWVHPRVHAVPAPAGGRRAHPDGGEDLASPQATTTFESLREYAIGDDLRRIHWRSTAHLGTLMVRNDLDAASPTCVLWLDTSRRSYADDDQFERAVEEAASVVVAATADAVPVRLMSSSGLDLDSARFDRAGLLDGLAGVALDDAAFGTGSARMHDPRAEVMLVLVTGPRSRTDPVAVDHLCRRFGSYRVVRIEP